MSTDCKSALFGIRICFFLVLFVSCSTSKNKRITPETEVVKCLDDFIKNYPKLKPNKELTSVLFQKITENDTVYYQIMDEPKNEILATLNDIENKKSKYHAVSVYKKILCEYNKKDFNLENLSFQLLKNNEIVQDGNTQSMLWKIDELISYVSQYFTLKKGDIIFTGTPAGVGKVSEHDVLLGKIEDLKAFEIRGK